MNLNTLSCCVALMVPSLALAVDPPSPAARNVSPAQWLKLQPKPKFREGYTLPRLTRYGWTLPFDVRVELTEEWGYALEFGGYVGDDTVKRLDDPASMESRLAALTMKDPKRYPLAVICSRQLPGEEAPPETWTRDKDGKVLNGQAKSMDGTTWSEEKGAVFSPEAPDSVWKMAGEYRASPFRQMIKRGIPISIVLNGGEYGLGVPGFARKIWEQDPTIMKAKGEKSWFEYTSKRKARAEILIADAVKAAVPQRDLYIYYVTTGGTHRNHAADWMDWGPGYQWLKPVSDLASSEHYHRHFNSGWVGEDNILTQALNARGYEIAQGYPLSYDWLCAGWPRESGLGSGAKDRYNDGGLGNLDLYRGFLKCMYTAGMVGGNAGFYDFPRGGFEAQFPANNPPHWLLQMTAFSCVHALFSFHENMIRQGDLLSGPDQHVWSKDQPAYELSTGSPDLRVLARKLRDKPQWLITAWAADGKARPVKVAIPELGEVTLEARATGSVYEASLKDGKQELKQVD